jgi:hypothetical protein
VLDAVVRYRAHPVSVLRAYWDLYRYRRFSPNEIHFLQLLDPGLSPEQLEQVVSKEELLAVQRALNPADLHPLTEDKLRFHAHCRATGLPVPALLAVLGVSREAASDVPRLDGEEALAAFLRTVPHDELIVKPVDGARGKGVTRLRRGASGWTDHRGVPTPAAALCARMQATGYRQWMVQERIRGHPDLDELSATDALQTVRMVTFVDGAGDASVLAARLRLICGDAAHDNFDYGRNGNLIANVDVATGAVKSVVGSEGDPPAIQRYRRHRRTGRELIGYRVPEWSAVRELALRAAQAFRPLRTIGWDVAITPTHTCLIEGNVTWDPLSGEPRMGEIYRRLVASAAGQRHEA